MKDALGPVCRRCRTSEASCARTANRCCNRCTHAFGEAIPAARCEQRQSTVARVSRGIAPYVAICLGCGHMTSRQRLISVVLAELTRAHDQKARAAA